MGTAPPTRLAAAVSDHQDLVPPLDEAQLREAIARPAELCGAEFEPGLVGDLVHDMRGQTGALPLLQHTLHELWERRSGRRLTHAAYGELGRLDGALQRRAEEIYAGFSPAEQDLCRRIFLRLTQLGRGTEDTKRRVAARELLTAAADGNEIEKVLGRLAAERLVTMSGTAGGGERTVEVAHEALIRSWGRLRQWIDSRRQLLLRRERLGEAAGLAGQRARP